MGVGGAEWFQGLVTVGAPHVVEYDIAAKKTLKLQYHYSKEYFFFIILVCFISNHLLITKKYTKLFLKVGISFIGQTLVLFPKKKKNPVINFSTVTKTII